MTFEQALKIFGAAQSNNPEKDKGDKAAGVDPDETVDTTVAKGDQALVQSGKMTSLIKSALKEAGDDEDTRAKTMGMLVNTMLNTTFESGHLRREQLRDVVNEGEVPKDAMIHEVKGKSMIGEAMDYKKLQELYASDKEGTRKAIARQLTETYENVGDRMKDYRLMVEALRMAHDDSE